MPWFPFSGWQDLLRKPEQFNLSSAKGGRNRPRYAGANLVVSINTEQIIKCEDLFSSVVFISETSAFREMSEGSN